MTPNPAASASLDAYARNVTRSLAGWGIELRPVAGGTPAPALVAGEPLRRLRVEGEDLVIEFGQAPGRPRRVALTGPLDFTRQHSGRALEIRLRGPRGTEHALVLAPS